MMLDRYIRDVIERQTCGAFHEYIDVTFPAGANTDHIIATTLRPADPESIRYVVVSADRAVSLYHDQSATRRPWGVGYLILRASVANAVVRLHLFVEKP